ncbi:hypothetical protein JCM16161A_21930 [Vulcanisaeta sp. JCM 16161]|uniref:hypothetical protein n=1 Tax=Vulcanisaeta sp. JCM 16161 TaxID=1295372 RepID=UPI0006D26CA3|nr:hypothetical protein [Vulcanisaeta sp. JCM 16161]
MSKVITINGNIACIKYDLVCGKGVDALCTDYTKAPTSDNIYLVEIKGKNLTNAIENIEKTLKRDPNTGCGLVLKPREVFIVYDGNTPKSQQYESLKIQLMVKYKLVISEIPFNEANKHPIPSTALTLG